MDQAEPRPDRPWPWRIDVGIGDPVIEAEQVPGNPGRAGNTGEAVDAPAGLRRSTGVLGDVPEGVNDGIGLGGIERQAQVAVALGRIEIVVGKVVMGLSTAGLTLSNPYLESKSDDPTPTAAESWRLGITGPRIPLSDVGAAGPERADSPGHQNPDPVGDGNKKLDHAARSAATTANGTNRAAYDGKAVTILSVQPWNG